MAEVSNKIQKKGNITQQHIYSLLQRYSVTTVLTLLKEVAQAADVSIDWNELVKKTATGISSAREYQMLWRHLAYCHTLEEKLDEGAEPMDDDSDLEFELETLPPVSSDASTEAAACVKVMIASASLVDSDLSSAVEAPLTINIPSGWSSSTSSENPQLQETNMTVPVLVPKQSVTLSRVPSVEALDAIESAAANLPPRRKRKPWSKEEDEELIAAVQRNGEGNWANILKGDFKGDRTPSQLSQRWAIMKKRKENSTIGVAPQLADFNALRRAFHMALDMPVGDNSKSTTLNGKVGTNPNPVTTPIKSIRSIAGEPSQLGTQSHCPYLQDSDPTTSSKSRYVNSMKTSTSSPTLGSDAMVKAAAVAAGARIATPSDAATLLKAAQSKNAVHIIPSGPNSIRSSGPNNLNSLPPNVHYIRTGLVNRSVSGHNNVITNASRPVGTHQAQSQITKPSVAMALTNSTQTANESNSLKEKLCKEAVVSGSGSAEQILKSAAGVSCNEAKDNIQDQAMANYTKELAQEDPSALLGSETHLETENNNVEDPRCLSPSKVDGETDITGIGAKNRSEKGEDDKMIELADAEERENKPTAEEKLSEKWEENRMIDMPVEEEREDKSTDEKNGTEMEENKMIEMPVEEEGEKESTAKENVSLDEKPTRDENKAS